MARFASPATCAALSTAVAVFSPIWAPTSRARVVSTPVVPTGRGRSTLIRGPHQLIRNPTATNNTASRTISLSSVLTSTSDEHDRAATVPTKRAGETAGFGGFSGERLAGNRQSGAAVATLGPQEPGLSQLRLEPRELLLRHRVGVGGLGEASLVHVGDVGLERRQDGLPHLRVRLHELRDVAGGEAEE